MIVSLTLLIYMNMNIRHHISLENNNGMKIYCLADMFQAADFLNDPVHLSASIWSLLNLKSVKSRVECM